MEEHRLIEQVLDALVLCTEALKTGSLVRRSDVGEFVRFFQRFADAGHHGKEEDILFKVMISHGFPAGGGPIPVMLAEHEAGRSLVRALDDVAASTGEWAEGEKAMLLGVAQDLRSHLRAHIVKEDNILYPMAANHLPASALEELASQCGAFQDRWHASGWAARLERLGKHLVARWGP